MNIKGMEQLQGLKHEIVKDIPEARENFKDSFIEIQKLKDSMVNTTFLEIGLEEDRGILKRHLAVKAGLIYILDSELKIKDLIKEDRDFYHTFTSLVDLIKNSKNKHAPNLSRPIFEKLSTVVEKIRSREKTLEEPSLTDNVVKIDS